MSNNEYIGRLNYAKEILSKHNAVEALTAFESIIESLRNEPPTMENEQIILNAVSGSIDSMIATGDHASALNLVQKATAEYGRLPSLLLQSGRIYMLEKNYTYALKEFKNGISSIPAGGEDAGLRLNLHLHLIEALILMQEYEEAERYCHEALSEDPANPELLVKRIKILYVKDKKPNALIELKKLKAMFGGIENPCFYREMLLLSAEVNQLLKDWTEVWGIAGKDTQYETDVRERIRNSGRQLMDSCASLKKWGKAWKICRELLSNDDNCYVWHIWAGRANVAMKQYVEAQKYFEQGLVLIRNCADDESRWLREKAYEGIVEISLQTGNIKLLEEAAPRILSERQPSLLYIVINIIEKFRSERRFEQAEKLCLELLDTINTGVFPIKNSEYENKLLDTYLLLIRIAYDQQDYQKTLTYAAKLISLYPKQSDANIICAEIYIKQGDQEKALSHLRSVNSVSKSGPFILWKELYHCYEGLSELLITQKDYTRAIECFRSMLIFAFCPVGNAEELDIDALYEKLNAELEKTTGMPIDEAEVSSEGVKSFDTARAHEELYLNQSLNEVHRQNPRSFLNTIYNMVELLRGDKVLKTKPVSMVVSLTGKCNLNCVMCGESGLKSWDIPVSIVEEIKSLYPYLKSIQWRGGEAFLSPYFVGLVETALQYPHLEQSLNTNGLLIDEAWAERLARGNFNVIFSIDGICLKTYEAVMRGGKFEKLLNSLRLIKNAREKTNSKMKISMTFIIMKANYQDLPYLVDFAKEYGIDELRVTKLAPYGQHSFYDESILSDILVCNEVKQYLRKIAVDAPNNRITFCNWFGGIEIDEAPNKISVDEVLKDVPAKNLSNNYADGKICMAPWQNLFINTGGDIFPHCFCATKLGNISSGSLSSFWNGAVMRSLRVPDPKCRPTKLSRCEEVFLNKSITSVLNMPSIYAKKVEYDKEKLSDSRLIMLEKYASSGTWDKAWEECRELLFKDESNVNLHIWAGRIKTGMKQYKEAVENYRKVLELIGENKDDESVILKKAAYSEMIEEYFKVGEIEKADKVLSEQLLWLESLSEGKVDEDIILQLWRGRIKSKLKQHVEAAGSYAKVFELTGEKQEEGMEWVKETAYRGMVEAYIERGETDKAEGLAIELLGKGEEKAEDLIKSINDGYKKGKELRKIYKFGMRIYKKLPEGAEQLRQEVRDTGLKLIAEHVEKEEWGKAYEICEGLINEDPKNVNWYIWAGRVKAGMKKYKEAAENYEKVLELVGGAKDDESVMLKKAAYNGMIEAYLGTGEIEKADNVLSEQLLWLESVPECKEAGEEVLELWRRGRIQAGMKQHKEAGESYEKVLELVGGAKDDESVMLKKAAYNGMIEAYLGTGEIEKADNVLSEQLLWLESVPKCKEAGEAVLELWRRGRIQAGMKQHKEAGESYEKVLELIGGAKDDESVMLKKAAYNGMIEAYLGTGEIEKADKVLSEQLLWLESVPECKEAGEEVLELWRRGRIKAGMKKYKEAAENYGKVLELIGEKQEEGMEWVKETAYRGITEAYIDGGETDKAEELAIELLGKGEKKAEDLIKSINDKYKKGNETRKEHEFGMRIYAKLPEGAEQLRQEVRDTGLKLITEHVEKEEWEKAQEISEGLINEDPKNVNWYIWAGRVKAGMKKYKEAAENYEKVFELTGEKQEEGMEWVKETAYRGMVEAYIERGETDKAEGLAIELLGKGEEKAEDLIKSINDGYKKGKELRKDI